MTYSEIIEFSTSQDTAVRGGLPSLPYLIYKLIYAFQLELNGFWKEVIRNLHVAHATRYTLHRTRRTLKP